MDDLYINIENVGLLSGNEDTAQQVITDIQERVAAVDAALENITTTPTVFYELDATDPTKPYTPGQNTFYSTLISQAGGQNIGDVLETDWAQISLEELLIQDPDIILLGDSVWGVTPESLAEREGWSTLRAIQSGNVLPFDDNLLARPGPRWIDGLEALAQLIHPEAFE
jgi:iron complex transport system substrate-binding protein